MFETMLWQLSTSALDRRNSQMMHLRCVGGQERNIMSGGNGGRITRAVMRAHHRQGMAMQGSEHRRQSTPFISVSVPLMLLTRGKHRVIGIKMVQQL